MNDFPDFSAIIFDMDGLVLDTENTYCIAWQKAAVEMGLAFSTAFCLSMSGLHYQDVEQKLKNECGADFDLKHFFNLSGRYWREHVNQLGIPVKKGFFTLIDILKANDIPFCLATNSLKINALECLKLAGVDDFSIIVCRDDVLQGKPAADIFLLAAEKLMQPISQCLVIEDSSTGIQAAVNAKAPSIFIPSVFPYQQTAMEQADCLLSDLDELAQIILNSYIHPV